MPITIDIAAVRDALLSAGTVTLAIGVLWRAWGKPMQTWFFGLDRTVKAVDEQLKINGEDDLLPRNLAGLPLRSLVIQHILMNTEAHQAASGQTALLRAARELHDAAVDIKATLKKEE